MNMRIVPAAGPRLGAAFAANALPAVISMLLTSGVVLVDGAFLGRVAGAGALAAVNLSLPVLYAFMGAALLAAVGFSSPAAIALGAGDGKAASRHFSAAVVTVLVVSTLAALACAAFAGPLVGLLSRGASAGSDAAALSPLLGGYLAFMLPGYVVMMLNVCLSVFARAEGKPLDALAIGLAANVVNVFLDWLFIARLGWGTAGAAAATSLANAAGCALGLARVLSGRSVFRFARPRFSVREYLAALANGGSEAIGQLSVTITTWLYNGACLRLMGAAGLAAFSVAGYLSFVESMIVTGLCIGMAPMAGRAYGAGRSREAVLVFRLAAVVALAAGGLSFVAMAAGGRAAASFWTGGDPAVAALAARGFALVGLSFLANGFNALASAWFTALCDAARSGLVALLRGLVLPVAAVLLLPLAFGPLGLWLAMPVTEALTLPYAAPAMYQATRRLAEAKAAPL